MHSIVLISALAVMSQQAAPHLPAHLRCEVSGESGCSADGICVGGGRHYPKVSMTIDAERKVVVINDIGGRIDGTERLDFDQRRTVFWHPDLFGLSTIHVRPEPSRNKEGKSFTTVELTNGSHLVEFQCRAN
jgi:hypothetical protein